MSLDVYLTAVRPTEVYSRNITHNLNKMAMEAGIYEALWRPEEIGVTTAKQLVPLLETGLETLRSDPERFEKFNPENGWGDYENLVSFVETYLQACKENPDAEVRACR
jgi:hypothetical protein